MDLGDEQISFLKYDIFMLGEENVKNLNMQAMVYFEEIEVLQIKNAIMKRNFETKILQKFKCRRHLCERFN